ncbi:MAG: SCP2 sterol-binding domain-containing protein, partial [Candidatus Cybelea sp.]
LPRPPGGVAYELTSRGRALEESVVAIGRWGAKLLDVPRDGEIVTVDSLAMALRTTFRPEAAADLRARFELHIGELVVHAIVDGPAVAVGRGPVEKPDLIVESSPALKELMSGEITPRQALASGAMRITGSRKLFDRFAQVFRI